MQKTYVQPPDPLTQQIQRQADVHEHRDEQLYHSKERRSIGCRYRVSYRAVVYVCNAMQCDSRRECSFIGKRRRRRSSTWPLHESRQSVTFGHEEDEKESGYALAKFDGFATAASHVPEQADYGWLNAGPAQSPHTVMSKMRRRKNIHKRCLSALTAQ